MPMFGELLPDGTVRGERFIEQEVIMRCQFFIMAPEHYREDDTCRCDDPSHLEMAQWGYVWNQDDMKWRALA